jgi:hypothetical protein
VSRRATSDDDLATVSTATSTTGAEYANDSSPVPPPVRTTVASTRRLLTQYGAGGSKTLQHTPQHLLTSQQQLALAQDDGDEYGELPNFGIVYISHACATRKCTGRQQQQSFADCASDAALTHRLQRKNLPAKCYHCDGYTFFATIQCAECLMAWHKNCLPDVNMACGPSVRAFSALPRRMSIFGVPLAHTVLDVASDPPHPVPLIVRRCVQQLDRRGLCTKVRLCPRTMFIMWCYRACIAYVVSNRRLIKSVNSLKCRPTIRPM